MSNAQVKIATIMPKQNIMKFWMEKAYNVLLIGRHGVGKTTMIRDLWENEMGWKEGIDYKYLSASTLDPWVDLVGIPTEDDTDGNRSIAFIQPKWLFSVKAILIDELNRSHPKVRNALMEFIQFHAVNGKKLPNLKYVWAAINPEDDDEFDYDVETLDPATKDRFQIQIHVPNEPNFEYFARKYNDRNLASGVVNWWKTQIPAVKDIISPRRLDYAIEYIQADGDIRHILSEAIASGAKTQELVTLIRTSSPILRNMRTIFKSRDKEAGKKFITDESNYAICIGELLRAKNVLKFFLPLMPMEKISKLFREERVAKNFILQNLNQYEHFRNIAEDIRDLCPNGALRQQITDALNCSMPLDSNNVMVNKALQDDYEKLPSQCNGSELSLSQKIAYHNAQPLNQTYDRKVAFKDITSRIPQSNWTATGASNYLAFLEEKIIGRSHTRTFEKEIRQSRKRLNGPHYGQLMGILNTAYLILYDASPLNHEGYIRVFSKVYPKIWRLIKAVPEKFCYPIRIYHN